MTRAATDTARERVRARQHALLHALAHAQDAGPLRSLAHTDLRDDICEYLRARHVANSRGVLAFAFPVLTRALQPSDAELRRLVTELPGPAWPGARVQALASVLRALLHERDGGPALLDLWGFERAIALLRLRGPQSLDRVLADIERHALCDEDDAVDLGSVVLTRVTTNAPELFLRSDPLEAQPLGWSRRIAHVYRVGWSSPRWFEFTELRQLRIHVAMAG